MISTFSSLTEIDSMVAYMMLQNGRTLCLIQGTRNPSVSASPLTSVVSVDITVSSYSRSVIRTVPNDTPQPEFSEYWSIRMIPLFQMEHNRSTVMLEVVPQEGGNSPCLEHIGEGIAPPLFFLNFQLVHSPSSLWDGWNAASECSHPGQR